MRTSAIRAELIKLRRAPIWVAFVALPLIAAAIGTFNYESNIEILQLGWLDLWTQHTLFLSMFFLPALVGASCSWLMRLEHSGGNWNLLVASPVGVMRLILAKLLVGWLMLGVGLVAVGALFVGFGKLAGMSGMPDAQYAVWLLFAWVGGIACVAWQLFFSLVIRSFAAPVGIAVAGGLAGFFMYARGIWFACPYSLMTRALNSNGIEALTSGDAVVLVVVAVLYTAVAVGSSVFLLSKSDVRGA
ncbi:Uncharacterized protein conserved in bacteria [Slackia heliotrinireducens]|uniref:Uncharacterized conserved protein n=1 Tax=Slackia heliotrinireducens (strain ATCC 29202 / DSM 20476 / NCTC 11029 / RHS 1) TaxID=471855 RepID=C7N3P7_SLAHD|nr:ABC transporter permease [Slackia heliotrinireducens]ACV21638.1 uncharacterized conserved protein [Slackia heliotrinireducens DSM 20476]VEG99218.1 Uncharacterized protein conserved in bacteria [Slackia heliotrinireducens]